MAHARPTIPGVLLVVALVLVPVPRTASKQPEPSTTPTRFPPLLDCSPPAPVAAAGESAFRGNILSLLRIIPSAAAAAPTGFVSVRLGRTGLDLAFARGLCFGAANTSAAAGCRACLSAAARDATDGCGASRRAGCFLSYADTEALSAREEQFRGWFYANPDDTTAATTLEDRVCAGDRTAPDCDRCFKDAARAAVALPWLVRMRREVIVVGYSCSLHVHSYVLPIDIMDTRRSVLSWMLTIVMTAQLVIVELLLLFIVFTLLAQDL